MRRARTRSTPSVADKALSRLEIDALGLDAMDRRYLTMIADLYGGGPVGVETLAAGLSEPRDTIEDVIEPFLIQLGLIARTARGRCLNGRGYAHLGLPVPQGSQSRTVRPDRMSCVIPDMMRDPPHRLLQLRWIRRFAGMTLASPAQPQHRVVLRITRRSSAWLCLPGRADTCSTPLPTTALNPNGYGSTGPSSVAKDPPLDCFYVYPTVSRDQGLNSDLNAGPEEKGAAEVQFARFAGVCRTFAPIYRQMTVAAVVAMSTGARHQPGRGAGLQ